MVKNSELYKLLVCDELHYYLLIGNTIYANRVRQISMQEDALKSAGCEDIFTNIVSDVKTAALNCILLYHI